MSGAHQPLKVVRLRLTEMMLDALDAQPVQPVSEETSDRDPSQQKEAEMAAATTTRAEGSASPTQGVKNWLSDNQSAADTAEPATGDLV